MAWGDGSKGGGSSYGGKGSQSSGGSGGGWPFQQLELERERRKELENKIEKPRKNPVWMPNSKK